MTHQCVRCSTFYEDGSKELLEGCNKCGGKFFFFIRGESVKKVEKITQSLSAEDKKQMEEDVVNIIGDKFEEDKPIVLDLENINVLKPGKFEINLIDLFRGKPLVYKLEEGKYFIDVPSTFQAKEFGLEKKKDDERKPLDLDDEDPGGKDGSS